MKFNVEYLNGEFSTKARSINVSIGEIARKIQTQLSRPAKVTISGVSPSPDCDGALKNVLACVNSLSSNVNSIAETVNEMVEGYEWAEKYAMNASVSLFEGTKYTENSMGGGNSNTIRKDNIYADPDDEYTVKYIAIYANGSYKYNMIMDDTNKNKSVDEQIKTLIEKGVINEGDEIKLSQGITKKQADGSLGDIGWLPQVVYNPKRKKYGDQEVKKYEKIEVPKFEVTKMEDNSNEAPPRVDNPIIVDKYGDLTSVDSILTAGANGSNPISITVTENGEEHVYKASKDIEEEIKRIANSSLDYGKNIKIEAEYSNPSWPAGKMKKVYKVGSEYDVKTRATFKSENGQVITGDEFLNIGGLGQPPNEITVDDGKGNVKTYKGKDEVTKYVESLKVNGNKESSQLQITAKYSNPNWPASSITSKYIVDIENPQLGDVNGDGNSNIADVVVDSKARAGYYDNPPQKSTNESNGQEAEAASSIVSIPHAAKTSETYAPEVGNVDISKYIDPELLNDKNCYITSIHDINSPSKYYDVYNKNEESNKNQSIDYMNEQVNKHESSQGGHAEYNVSVWNSKTGKTTIVKVNTGEPIELAYEDPADINGDGYINIADTVAESQAAVAAEIPDDLKTLHKMHPDKTVEELREMKNELDSWDPPSM